MTETAKDESGRRCPLTVGPRDATIMPKELAERMAAVGAAYPAGSPTASKAALGVIVEYLLSNGCADAVEELERLVGGAVAADEAAPEAHGRLEATAIFVDEANFHGAGEAAIAVERAVGETKGEA